jgi:hypothetical protein
LPREDDVFEVEDREVVIFKLFGGVGGNNVPERANQLPQMADRCLGHGAQCTDPWMAA